MEAATGGRTEYGGGFGFFGSGGKDGLMEPYWAELFAGTELTISCVVSSGLTKPCWVEFLARTALIISCVVT